MSAQSRMARASLASLIVTALARPFRGPLRPSWSFRHEVAVGAMKRFFRGTIRLPAPQLRAAWEALQAPPLKGVQRERLTIGAMTAEWFTPPGAGGARVLLYLHGGAYVWGSSQTHADLISRLAIASRARVFAPNYRLAPEHPCPAAHDDALAAYRWLLDHGTPADEIVAGGDSAGGNLALSLALRIKREGLPMLRGLALISPWVDLGREGGSGDTHARYDWIIPELTKPWARTYYPSGALAEPLASPLHADLAGLPPTLIQLGGAEVLFDQVVDMARALDEARVRNVLTMYPDMVHVWHLFVGLSPELRPAITEYGRFVRDPDGFAHQATSGAGIAGLANK